jgi:hypothetical protein
MKRFIYSLDSLDTKVEVISAHMYSLEERPRTNLLADFLL